MGLKAGGDGRRETIDGRETLQGTACTTRTRSYGDRREEKNTRLIGPRWHSIFTCACPALGDHSVTVPLPCPQCTIAF
eukprot:31514-Pelagococcus_subviridis.AAC.10